MTVKVYREDDANATILDDGSRGSGGMRFNKELLAVGNGDGTITVLSPARGSDTEDFAEVSNIAYTEFRDEQDVALGTDEAGVVNALNAVMSHTGGADPVAPVITSATAVTITDGDAINYELVATGGVGFEWSGLPEGMAIKNGSPRKLIGTPVRRHRHVQHHYDRHQPARFGHSYACRDCRSCPVRQHALN